MPRASSPRRAKPATGAVRVKSPAPVEEGKRPFRYGAVLPRIRRALKSAELADAAMFELRERGHGSVFEQLVACVISIRTRDEVSLPAALHLLERARTPEAMARLSEREIDERIRTSTFHEAKARTIREIARRAVEEHGGELPCDFDVLTSMKGVGPKCANLALGIACGQARVSVDIHVHRIANR